MLVMNELEMTWRRQNTVPSLPSALGAKNISPGGCTESRNSETLPLFIARNSLSLRPLILHDRHSKLSSSAEPQPRPAQEPPIIFAKVARTHGSHALSILPHQSPYQEVAAWNISNHISRRAAFPQNSEGENLEPHVDATEQ